MLHIDVRGTTEEPSTLQDWLPRFQELQILQLNSGTLHYDHFHVLPKVVELELFAEATPPLPIKRLASILRACPSLQRLQLRDVVLEDAADVDLTPIPFSHLNTLILNHVHVASVISLLSSTSGSLNLTICDGVLDLSSDNLADRIRLFSRRTTITALDLTVAGFGRDFHGLLRLFPHLLTLSLQNIFLNGVTVHTLQGPSELDEDAEAAPPIFPALQAIWLSNSSFDNEEVLRTLVRAHPLRQLKLDRCFLVPLGSILEAKALHEYLLDSVPDLIIIE
ncbi:hypothetical protein BDV93DRAFT_520991 [Ceratobasidium sp. AG-I]|nr:hypothetical protein BDV93DRAFT_520991 [Ceratobasidium sp. AG-I]